MSGRSAGTGGAYTSGDGKRKSSMGHARHAWTCYCGRVCRGNGGKASHQRACSVWAERRLATVEQRLADPHYSHPSMQERYTVERDQLRERLGKTPAVRNEYAQEVAELLERLDDADSQLTPEHVAQRFQELEDRAREGS